jgi:hypothetical protein
MELARPKIPRTSEIIRLTKDIHRSPLGYHGHLRLDERIRIAIQKTTPMNFRNFSTAYDPDHHG